MHPRFASPIPARELIEIEADVTTSPTTMRIESATEREDIRTRLEEVFDACCSGNGTKAQVAERCRAVKELMDKLLGGGE